MGVDVPGPGPEGRRRPVSRVVRVVPDVATFALDEGFSYLEPDDLTTSIGSIVRVPLGSRIVRGWVVAVEGTSRDDLRPIRGVSGTLPVFGPVQLETLRWLARYYVAPLASILRAATPPNLPTRVPRPEEEDSSGPAAPEHFPGLEEAWARIHATPGSVVVIAPTGIEVAEAAGRLRRSGREVVEVAPDATHREVTRAWSRGRLDDEIVLVGTGRLALWWVRGLRAVILTDEGRRSHKERQAPTLHPRTILARRAQSERFFLATTGLVPTLEVLASGASFTHDRRLWPTVEVVDRNEDPPGRGLLSDRVKQAVHQAVRQDMRTLVFTHRRGYAPAFRCTSCGELRRCSTCAAAATNTGVCPRCGNSYGPCTSCGRRTFEPLGAAVGRLLDLLGTLVGPAQVGRVGSGSVVQVGTERDLVGLPKVGLAVVVDGDRLLLGPNFRATEEGLRLVARLASLVDRGPGHRFMMQTSIPNHPAVEALRLGNPDRFLTAELDRRREGGLPPAGDLIVLETRGQSGMTPPDLEGLAAAGATTFGPHSSSTGERWLIQGSDLGPAKDVLRPIVRRLREQETDVRVDVDPLDL